MKATAVLVLSEFLTVPNAQKTDGVVLTVALATLRVQTGVLSALKSTGAVQTATPRRASNAKLAGISLIQQRANLAKRSLNTVGTVMPLSARNARKDT